MTRSRDISDTVEALAAMADIEQRGATVNTAAMARFLAGGDTAMARVHRPFEQSLAVHRCLRVIAEALRSMPLMVSTMDDQLVESGDVIDLLDNPHPGMTGDDLIEWTVALVMLTGACYWVKQEKIGQRPMRVRPVSAVHCRPVFDSDGELAGYDFVKPGSRASRPQRLDVDEVIPFLRTNFQTERLFDPLSSVGPAKMAIDQVFAADIANLESLHNGVDPGLAFTFPGRPTDDQVRDFRQMLDARHGGPVNRNRPLFLFDGLDVKDFVKKFTEMEFARLKEMSTRDICIALGVPPAVIGLVGDGSLGHGKETEEAHAIFWAVTVLPMAHWIARKITVNLLPDFQGQSRTFMRLSPVERFITRCPTYKQGRRKAIRLRVRAAGRTERAELFAWFDSSQVDAVRDAAIRRTKEAVIWHEKLGATQADVIEAVDAPIPADHPWQQTWWKPLGLVDVQDETAGLPPENTEPPEEPEDEVPPAEDEQMAVRALTELQRSRLWQAWWLSVAPLARRTEAVLTKALFEARKQTLSRAARVLGSLEDGASKSGSVTRDLIGQILFDIIPLRKKLVARARPLLRTSFELGGTQTMSEAATAGGNDKPDPFNIPSDVASRMRAREIRLTGALDKVRRQVAQSLSDGLAAQETNAQLAERIRHEFQVAGSRARTIAMTETGGAVEEGRHAARSQAKVPLKSWLSSRKQTSRANHLEMERLTADHPIPVDQEFLLPQTDGRAMYPRASTLDAKDIVNCACTTLNRFPGDRDAALIQHLMTKGFVSLSPEPAHEDPSE